MDYTGGPVAGGTIMGIHNLAIVFPQFIVSRGCTVWLTVDRHCRLAHLQTRGWGLGGDTYKRVGSACG